MSGRRRLRAALALWAAAGAGCGVIGDSERLTDAQEVIVDMKIGPADRQPADLKIAGAVDHADRRYRVGEPIVLSVEVNQAAFVAVLQVMPNGATRLIFPNRRHANAQLAANSPLRLAENIAAEKPGVALFEFVASTRGASWLFNSEASRSRPILRVGHDDARVAQGHRHLAPGSVTAPGTAASHLALRVEGE